MSPSVYCCGSLPAIEVPANIVVTSSPGSEESRIESSGFGTSALGIGRPPRPALGIGADGIGADGIGALGIGALGIGALGIGADGIGALGIGAAPTAALGIGADGIGADAGSPVASCVKGCGGRLSRANDCAPAVVDDWSTVNVARSSLEIVVCTHAESSDVLPDADVAVAVTTEPGSTATGTDHTAVPAPSVVAVAPPRNVTASLAHEPSSGAGLWKTSTVYGVFGALPASVPPTCAASAAVIAGAGWPPFEPLRRSIAGPRPFSVSTEFPVMRFPALVSFSTAMPAKPFPRTVLPWPSRLPPTVLFEAL